MKKFLYSFLGCVSLLAIIAVSGHGAVSQVFDNVRSKIADSDHEGEYLRSASVVDLSVIYDAVADRVNLSFTSPRIASWSLSYDDEPITQVDYIRIYRNEGSYYSANESVMVKEYTDVAVGTDLEWSDPETLEHGKTYYYMVIPGIADHDGQTSGSRVEVGLKIDPATNYEVLPGERGAKEATIKFTAPTTANDGKVQVTTPIDSIEVIRKKSDWYSTEQVIHTFTNVQPGAELSHTDRDAENLEEGSKYDYRIILYWDGGSTRDYTNVETVLIGQDMPVAPSDIAATLQDDGKVKITWAAPESGVNGGWFDAEAVTYKVERGVQSGYYWKYTSLAEGLTALQYVDETIAEEGKYRYRVTSCLNGKESRSEESQDIIAGPPSAMPFYESWPDQTASHSTWAKTSGWNTTSSQTVRDSDWNTICEVTPFDYDNGFMYMKVYNYASEVGDVETLTSGRIDFSEAVDPFIKFYFFDIDPEYYDNELKVYISADGGEFEELTDIDCQSGPGLNEWIPFSGSLSSFVGAEYIQVRFQVTVGAKFAFTAIDGVEVRNRLPVDLSVKSVSMPEKFYPGSGMNISVTIENTGDIDSEPFSTTVTSNGTEIAYAECAGIGTNQSVTIDLPVTISADTEAGIKTFEIEVVGGYEANLTNNSGSVTAEVVALPAVESFEHVVSDGRHKLTWAAVEELPFHDGDMEVSENFAAYETGTTGAIGNWTVIDGDGMETYSIPNKDGNKTYPGENEPTGGIVFTPSEYGATWDTPEPEGNCFAFIGAKGYANDWLISPKLNGNAQTLTFKAMAPANYGSELFRIMLSAGDNELTSFTELKSEKLAGNSGASWTEYTYEIPAGTKYFAINCTTNYGDALCLTDFHFITGSGLSSPATQHLGYNVYCDDSRLNSEVIIDNEYILPETPSNGIYTVKAAYNNAESHASQPQELVFSESGMTLTGASSFLLMIEGSTLIICGEGAYTVTDMHGLNIAAGNGFARVEVASGTYIVVVDGVTFKVICQ